MVKITDRFLALTIVTYLIWVCYYRLFGDSSSKMFSMLYFGIDGIIMIILLLRAFISQSKPVVCNIAKNVITVAIFFKIFQTIFVILSYTPVSGKYLVENNSPIWSVIGVLLILSMLTIFVINQLRK